MISGISLHCQICLFGKPRDTLGFKHMASFDIIISSHLLHTENMCYMASFCCPRNPKLYILLACRILMSLSENKHLYVCT